MDWSAHCGPIVMHAFRCIMLTAPRVAMKARLMHCSAAAPVRAFLSSSGPAFNNGRAAALRRGVEASKPLSLPWQPVRAGGCRASHFCEC